MQIGSVSYKIMKKDGKECSGVSARKFHMNYQDLQKNMFEGEREINLSSLFGMIIYKWRTILLLGLVFCLLGTAFQMFRIQKDEEQYEKSFVEYKRQLANYESSISTYEKERDAVQADITAIYKYIDKSVLVTINPYQEAYATADLLFDVEDNKYSLNFAQSVTIKNDGVEQVLGAYTSYLTNSISYEPLMQEYDLADRYIRELVGFSSDSSKRSISLSVRHVSQSDAEKILDYVISRLQQSEPTLSKDLPKHSFTVINKTVRDRVDNSLTTSINQEKSNASTTVLNSIYVDSTKTITALEARIEEIDSALETLEKEEPLRVEIAESTGIIKYALIGMFGGIVLTVFLFAVPLLLGGKVLDKDELGRSFGLSLLAAFPHRKKKGFYLDRLADHMLAADSGITDDEVYTVASKEINRVLEGKKENVLLAAGDNMKPASLQSLLEGLSKQNDGNHYLLADHFGNNLSTQQAMENCDKVVVAIGTGRTTMESVKNIVEKAGQYKKEVIGMILYY